MLGLCCQVCFFCGAWTYCRGFSGCGRWALGQGASGVVVHRPSRSGPWVQPLQGIWRWNLCLLNWQAESLPLSHQGSPNFTFESIFSICLKDDEGRKWSIICIGSLNESKRKNKALGCFSRARLSRRQRDTDNLKTSWERSQVWILKKSHKASTFKEATHLILELKKR